MDNNFASMPIHKNRGLSRKPLRTFTELACEFNIKPQALSRLLGIKETNPPKPILKSTGPSKNTWYSPTEMREWFLKEDVRSRIHRIVK